MQETIETSKHNEIQPDKQPATQLILQLSLFVFTVGLISFLYPLLEIQRSIIVEDVFHNKSIFGQFPFIYVSIIVLLLVSIIFNLSWKSSNLHPAITIFIRIIAFSLAWNYVFYDYNFYFDQWHSYDRLLILALVILTQRYPLLILPLLLQVNLMHHQFNFPFGGSSFLDKTLPYNLLMVSASYCLVLFISKRINPEGLFKIKVPYDKLLLYLLLITLAAPYYHSGLEKLLLSPNGYEWFMENDLSNNIKAMYHRGWLQSAPALNNIVVWFFSTTQIPGQFLILAGELAFLLLLFSRKFSFWLILTMLVLHMGVFMMNGALFWMWIVADIGMLYLLKKTNIQLSWKTGILGIICIHFSVNLLQVRALGWYDSPLDNRFELVADGERISEASMAPYTMHFQIGNVLALLDQKMINAGFLVFNYEQYNTMQQLHPHELIGYIEKEGTNRYNPEIEKNMRRFLTAYLQNDRENPFGWLKPPSYWNAHVFSASKVVTGVDVKTIQLFHQFEWNKEQEPFSFGRKPILTVSK